MTLTAALILLAVASDNFDSLAPQWVAGLRGLPDISFATIDGDSCLVLRATSGQPYPGADDLLRSFPSPVLASEHPFVQCHVWLPPFDQWPTQPNINGSYNYAGFRLSIIIESGNAFIWPALFIAGGPAGPHFTIRTRIDEFSSLITQAGWWTIAIGANTTSRLTFHAAPGKVDLTDADLIYTDPANYNIVRSFNGWFLDVIQTPGQTLGDPWYYGDVQLYAQPRPPVLDLSTDGIRIGLFMHGGYEQVPYTLQKSLDLNTWDDIAPMANEDLFTDPMTEFSQFYRLSP